MPDRGPSFHCLRCGECCSAMGDVHALEGDAAGGRCVVVNRYTSERTRSRSIPKRPAIVSRRRLPAPAYPPASAPPAKP